MDAVADPAPPTQLNVNIAGRPDGYLAASRAGVIDAGSHFLLVYTGEPLPGRRPHGVEFMLTPSGLAHFAEQGRDLLSRVPPLTRKGESRALPKAWQPLSDTLCATIVVNAVSNDLCSSDFYLLFPRAALDAQTRPGEPSSPGGVAAMPVMSCLTDIWTFAHLVERATRMAERKIKLLDSRQLVPPPPTPVANQPGTSGR